MAVKVTFTLDDETIQFLRLDAKRQNKAKSAVVREALREYHQRKDRLSEAERKRMLEGLDRYAASRPTRSQEEVDRELAEIRDVRRLPGRLHPVD